MNAGTKGYILINRLGERVGLLKHYAYLSPQGHHIDSIAVDVFTVHQYLAAHPATVYGIVHAVQTTQESTFTTARRANHGNHFVTTDIQANVFYGLFLAIKDIDLFAAHARRIHGNLTNGFANIAAYGSSTDRLCIVSYMRIICFCHYITTQFDCIHNRFLS